MRVVVPVGPVVVVGHSMGGMTILSHARQFPEEYGRTNRIVGAALISSAAQGLSRSPLGEILQNPALEAVRFAARYAPKLVHRTRGAVRSALRPILKTASYGDDRVSPSVVAFSEAMIHDTLLPRWWSSCTPWRYTTRAPPDGVVADPHNGRLRRSRRADADRSPREMAEALGDCELLIVPGPGIWWSSNNPNSSTTRWYAWLSGPHRRNWLPSPGASVSGPVVDDGRAELATVADTLALGPDWGEFGGR